MPPSRRDFLKQCAATGIAMSMARAEPAAPGLPGVRTHQCGRTRLDVINIGDITLPLASEMRAPPDANETDGQDVNAALAGQRTMPMQDVLVRGPGLSLMVDAGAYDIARDEPYAIPGYEPPAPLALRLPALGVAPEEVRQVVFTHRHFDHINGAVVKGADGRMRPLFPNARHYIQRADWDYVVTRMSDLTTRIGRTFSVLLPAGLVEVVEGDVELTSGVMLLAAPGETPGHQVVRVESGGHVAYLVGDMIHHPVEVQAPGFMVNWADEATNRVSRRRIHEAAASERALVVASHIPGTGRLSRQGGRLTWSDA